MILLLDNYDSFVHNLARYLRELGEEVEVRRNDRIDVEEARSMAPSHLVISPGPCTPSDAGVANELVEALAGEVPILGVCLGHQCVGEVFGGEVVRAHRPMHGKRSAIRHTGGGLFTGLPDPLEGVRYHSLVVDRASLPDALEVSAWTEVEGEVMALRHRELPVWGLQFHPEAVLTEHGHGLLAAFLALGRGEVPPGPDRDARARELVAADRPPASGGPAAAD